MMAAEKALFRACLQSIENQELTNENVKGALQAS
jgi:hypothetical protein